MPRRATLVAACAATAAALGASAALLSARGSDDHIAPREGLAERTLATLIAVPGGSFMAGNYDVPFLDADGTVQTRPAYSPANALAAHAVDLPGFLLQDREVSQAEFDLYLDALGLPVAAPDHTSFANLPDRPAAMLWQEARDYCAWLGQQVGLPMRLPAEAEWEYAARSGGLVVPWATDDGSYRAGQNVPAARYGEPESQNPPVASFPANPMGFHDMARGLYEWVGDHTPSDAGDLRVFKGGSNFSDALYETIPMRGRAEPLADSETLRSIIPADLLARMEHVWPAPVHAGSGVIGARCAADLPDPLPAGIRRAAIPAAMPGPFEAVDLPPLPR
ncbi:MAG: SUMF1/EgtB/PvdO family nonheme iron enzyme [Paracoccus sp. (in: a-proteobacteria)]|nr:SUMF1/EgtB/PvdO family nonheme iron enzyme [Paracoccus sp. (in: a-proteobacteria)]